MVTLGTAPGSIPKSAWRLHRAGETGPFHPQRHGDGFTTADQGVVTVIHNPQPLLALLHTFLSPPLSSDWGHGRKDRLR